MSQIYVTPVGGAQVPDPAIGGMLPASGRRVDYSQYWQRRIDEGVVTVSGSPSAINANTLRQPVSFATMADFNNAGGSAAYGVGLVVVAGVVYWCDASTLLPPAVSFPMIVFNAAPSNTASQNVLAIQAALNQGGEIAITTPGVYLINKTLIIKSNTTLKLGVGVTLKLDAFADCNILRNQAAGLTLSANAGGTPGFSRSANVVTVAENNHVRSVGDQVLIVGLLTDTSFNGLVTVASVSQNSWTYNSVGANGSPTGFAGIIPAYNQIPASSFTSVSNVVTVSEPGHTRKIGDPIYIGNLAGNASFNGQWEVKSVSGNTWTYVKTGTDTAPTGTAVVLGDNNINLVIDGSIDGNYANQGATALYAGSTQCFGQVFGNVGNFRRSGGRYLNQTKYTAWLYNCNDVAVDKSYYSTPSDGLHFEAPCDRVGVANQFGNTGDDLVAFTNVNKDYVGSGYQALANPQGMGNFGAVVVDGLFPANSNCPAIVKYASNTGYGFRNLKVRNVKGSVSATGSGKIICTDDTGCLTGGTIDSFVLDGWDVTGGSTGAAAFVSSLSGATGKITLDNFSMSDSNPSMLMAQIWGPGTIESILMKGFRGKRSSGTGVTVLALYAGTIGRVSIDGADVDFGNNAGSLVLLSTGGAGATVGTVMLNNVKAQKCNDVFNQGNGTVSEVFADNIRTDTVANGISLSSSGKIYANNVKATNVLNHFFQISGGTVRVVGKNIDIPPASLFLFNFGGSVISYSCSDASGGIDLGANAGVTPTGMTPLPGDVVWNTNATGAGLYGRTAAGAWTKIF